MADTDKLGPPFDTAQPGGLTDPRQGDNFIADVKQRLYNWGTREHNVDGKHKIPVSATPEVVDANAIGHLSVKTGTCDELYYDTGTVQKKLTSNTEIAALQAADATFTATDGSLQSQVTALDTRLDTAEADIDALQAASLKSFENIHIITTTGISSFTFPSPVNTFIIEMWGGAGGGGAGGGNDTGGINNAPGGGGGGSGGYIRHTVHMLSHSTPTLTVNVGVGGPGGVGNGGVGTNGTAGGLTSVSLANIFSLKVEGGGDGVAGGSGGNDGGSGGAATIGGDGTYYPLVDAYLNGNSGIAGVNGGQFNSGGAGGLPIYGMNHVSNGGGGSGGGADGSGGDGWNGGVGGNGIAGANGEVIIYY